MPRTHTYTVVELEVPVTVWNLIEGKLAEAGYDHAIDHKTKRLDLTGIALVFPATPHPPKE